VARGLICPGCGTKVGRKAHAIFVVGFLTGIITLPIGISVSYQITPHSLNDYVGKIVTISIPAALLVSGIISFVIVIKRERRHLVYVSKMPPGVIPLEKRSGFGNIVAKERWREANIRNSPRYAPLMKGTFPEEAFNGLVGNWDFPILSREQRMEHTLLSTQRLIKFLIGLIGLGLGAFFLGILFDMNPYLIIFGSTFILLGLLFIWAAHHAKKMVIRDVPAETKVHWKVVGFKTTIKVIEEFFKFNDLEYRREINDWPKNILYKNPEYKYILNNGNFISSLYSESKDGLVYGWITIGYSTSNYLQAKELQRDLDEYLGERDLIWRIA
jgi:hypothetical protein